MFATIRWRLAAWTMLGLVRILLAVGTVVYFAASRSLMDQVDRNLVSWGEQARESLGTPGRREAGEHGGYRGGSFSLLLGPDGSVIENPQRVRAADLQLGPLL